MILKRLRYFLRVAKDGSLGSASRSLGIAQPALGRQIQLLEAELGVRLFERVPKGMQMTEEGEYLCNALEPHLQMIDLVLKNVKSYSTRIEATLVFGLPPILSDFIGSDFVRRLKSDLPNLRLRFVQADSGKLAEDLGQGLVDIALLTGAPPDNRCYQAEVVSETLMLAVPAGDPLARRGSIAFAELSDLPLILPGIGDSLRILMAKHAADVGVEIEPILEIDSPILARHAVLAGTGYAILPPLAFKAELERREMAGIPSVEPEVSRPVFWAVQPRWRVPRSIYNAVEHAIFEEWYAKVESGTWPAKWLLDLDRLSSPISQPNHAAI